MKLKSQKEKIDYKLILTDAPRGVMYRVLQNIIICKWYYYKKHLKFNCIWFFLNAQIISNYVRTHFWNTLEIHLKEKFATKKFISNCDSGLLNTALLNEHMNKLKLFAVCLMFEQVLLTICTESLTWKDCFHNKTARLIRYYYNYD